MRTRVATAGLLAGALHMAGCGDSTEAGGAFTPEEQAALVTALGIDGISVHDWALRTVVDLAPEIGTMGQYSMLASQALVTLRLETFSTTYGVSRLDGWTELSAGTGTVASSIAVEAGFRETFPSSVSAIVVPDQTVEGEMRAYYREASLEFVANSGEFDLIASGFGNFEDCPKPPEERPNFDVEGCRYSIGTVGGSFRFNAGSAFSQPGTSFELPAVRVELDLLFNDPVKPDPETHLFGR